MYKRTSRPAEASTSRPGPVQDSDESRTKRANIANLAQGIATCAALFAGVLWVIGMESPEELATPIGLDLWDQKSEVTGGKRREDSLTIFLVATEENARGIYGAFGGNEGNAEIAALGYPMFRYEILVIPSNMTDFSIAYRYEAEAADSSAAATDAAHVVDLRASQ